MNDPLEQFIKQNRTEFDDKVPRLEVWAAINQAVNEQQSKAKVFSLWKFARVAATVAFLVTAGALGGIYMTQHHHAGIAGLSDVSPEMAELESFYQTEVDRKLVRLTSSGHFDDAIQDDLKQLEVVMDDLREELETHPERDKDVIINAMIQNYKTRIEILETVTQRIEALDSEKNKTKEHDKSINI